jgi:hypothetical protein
VSPGPNSKGKNTAQSLDRVVALGAVEESVLEASLEKISGGSAASVALNRRAKTGYEREAWQQAGLFICWTVLPSYVGLSLVGYRVKMMTTVNVHIHSLVQVYCFIESWLTTKNLAGSQLFLLYSKIRYGISSGSWNGGFLQEYRQKFFSGSTRECELKTIVRVHEYKAYSFSHIYRVLSFPLLLYLELLVK